MTLALVATVSSIRQSTLYIFSWFKTGSSIDGTQYQFQFNMHSDGALRNVARSRSVIFSCKWWAKNIIILFIWAQCVRIAISRAEQSNAKSCACVYSWLGIELRNRPCLHVYYWLTADWAEVVERSDDMPIWTRYSGQHAPLASSICVSVTASAT